MHQSILKGSQPQEPGIEPRLGGGDIPGTPTLQKFDPEGRRSQLFYNLNLAPAYRYSTQTALF
jgi:hypothetical protein